MGIAFLTKGPPALIPFIGIIFYIFLVKIHNKKKFFNIKFIFLFILISLSWYIIVVFKNHALLHYFINNELIGRIVGKHHRNSGLFDWTIYIPIVFFGLFPWIIYITKLRFNIDLNIKLLIYIITITLFIFCIVKSRLPFYILPIFPAMSLILGYLILNSGIKIPLKYFLFSAIFLISLRTIFIFLPLPQNSKLLFNKLKPFLKNNTEINLITSNPKYGLDFYLKQPCEYLDLFQEKKLNPVSKETVEKEIKEIFTPGYKENNIFVLFDRKKFHTLIKIFGKQKIKIRILSVEKPFLVKIVLKDYIE
jgi:hypothetical protein